LIGHRAWLDGVKLGSVDVLVSPIPDGAARQGKRRHMTATLGAIEKAYERWFDRCNANPDNVALFYFCGHGLQKDATLLLPADFGSSARSPWTRAIDFDATYRGMSNCAAQSQYFIIDTCRQWTQSLVQDLNAGGVRLGRSDITQQKPRMAPRLFGTAAGLAAFGGVPGKPSRLAEALIACMEGKAAEKKNGRWRIRLGNLGFAVKTMIELHNRSLPEGLRQSVDPQIGECAAEDRALLVLPEGAHPRVSVEFGCDPTEATEHAHFFHQGIRPQQPPCQADLRGAWVTEVLAGFYDCGAKIERHPFVSNMLESEPINPPGRPVKVPVTACVAAGANGRRGDS
jgi:hypothetical protein